MIELKPFNNKMKMQNEKDKNPYFPYNNQFHKESTEKKFKELEEQKSLKLNSKEEVQKIREMHERIAKNSQNEK